MTTRLMCGSETFDVRMQVLINLSLFQECPELLRDGYCVKLTTDARIFSEFLNTLEGNPVELSDRNAGVLGDLCKEFGFRELNLKVDEYVHSRRWTTHRIDVNRNTQFRDLKLGVQPDDQNDGLCDTASSNLRSQCHQVAYYARDSS